MKPIPEPVTIEIRSAAGVIRKHSLKGETLIIGRAPFCDLRFDQSDLPLVHSELHRQQGVIWIEAADSGLDLQINGRMYHRLALRDGDHLKVGSDELVFHIGEEAGGNDPRKPPEFDEDLSELSVDELCERILVEEAEIETFEHRRTEGWKGLIAALETTLAEGQAQEYGTAARVDAVIEELRQLSQRLTEQSQQLSEQEMEVLSVTNDLRVSQEAMSRKLDELLEQFDETDYRASA